MAHLTGEPTPGGQVLMSQEMRDRNPLLPQLQCLEAQGELGKSSLISLDCRGLLVTLGSAELSKVSRGMAAAVGTGEGVSYPMNYSKEVTEQALRLLSISQGMRV